MTDITIPAAALEAGARAMAKAGYAFSGIELTDPYTADADYWNECTRAAFNAMVLAWPGQWPIGRDGIEATTILLPLPKEGALD